MGNDEFDDDEFDDIPDEDLILALTQATSNIEASSSGRSTAQQNQGLPTKPQSASRATSQFAGAGTRVAETRPADKASDDYGLDDLPSDAFDSSPERESTTAARNPQRFAGPQSQSFRQTTLWGSTLREDRPQQSQAVAGRPFRADLPPEVPTHHELNRDELSTWVYPLNLGAIRDYQFSIVKNGLFNNTLVALPTGLGKTFIAATIMLNFLRWTKTAKAVFVAPTKPLVSQQVQACYGIAGIPRSETTLLTGETPPVMRQGEWESKRLFFMTPQTLMNDLSKGYADPKSIVLLVVDEAHRSTGDYAYVKVVEFMRRFSTSFRVLALTATPGSSVEAVQDVIDNLGISHVEIRTEESIDIRQYVHSRNINTVTFDPSDEMMEVSELFSKALKPLVNKLSAQNIYYGRDPMGLTVYGLLKAKQDWLKGPGRNANQGLKAVTIAVFTILQKLAHAIKLLSYHGIKPFYNNLAGFRSTEEERSGKLARQLLGDEDFKKMMKLIEGWVKMEAFTGHPKLAHLCETLVNHFLDKADDSRTRAIVFSEYRDSAEEIVRMLNRQPLIKATVFVGQADSKRSEGMKQKQQIETIEKFKAGGFNVLVATSIGEEGLDIGQVDLIVCYDASASPIRMLQRMGRTGRKRAGEIVLLLMKGKEEQKFLEAKDNYQNMQSLICEGSRFAFRHDLSTRIVPRDVKPEVDKRLIDIPVENTQDTSLPEPRKTAAKLKRKPPKKKFHMPDGVETGFMNLKTSFFGQRTAKSLPAAKKAVKVVKTGPVETGTLAVSPQLDKVVLDKSQTAELNRLYRDLPFRVTHMEEITAPSLGTYPAAQRTFRRTVGLKHGEYTKRCVKLFKLLGKSQDPIERYTYPYGETDTTLWETFPVAGFAVEKDGAVDEKPPVPRKSTLKRPHTVNFSDAVEQIMPREQQTPVRKVSKSTARKPRAPPTLLDDCEEVDDDEGDEPMTSPPARRGRKSKKKRRIGGAGDHIEDFGDDCMRTSDMDETDGSDSGADLDGFVIDDNKVTSSMQRVSTSPSTPGSSAVGAKAMGGRGRADHSPVRGAERPFFEPMEFPPTQDTDEDMPDIAQLVAMSASKKLAKRRANLRVSELDDEDDDDEPGKSPVRKPPVKRRCAVLADSDDDDG
ncbi:hypothetical protein B0H63DRAFT_462077 [Podospora didyma]|uniref:ATP-dependent DNA helicase n=1 Tax=Podospora didyma TaxID=330526 RepID=A0AAE0P7N0_9PEZI|nr:hypothetical protein B0H63DRAFT_462077 [Podospora didyma]